MFKTKKQLKEQLDFALGRCYGHEKSDALFKSIYEINQKQIDRLHNRINDLLAANGKLKRDLDIESSQKEELDSMLESMQKQTKNHTLNKCPDDCVCKTAGDIFRCAFCIRNPDFVDKYEVES